MRTGESIEKVLGESAKLFGRPGAFTEAIRIAISGQTALEVVTGLRVGMSLKDVVGNKMEVAHGIGTPLASVTANALESTLQRPRSKPSSSGPK